jgi:hypothetical protein
MAFIGRLHPLLIHFPIALVVMAALAEFVAMVTADEHWRRNEGVAAPRMASVAGNRGRRGGACGGARDRKHPPPLVWGANVLRP